MATAGSELGSIERRLEAAAASCARDGGRLTAVRRDVLRLILEAEHPMGAYPLLERLRESKRNAVPPTIYRALDFLLRHGLIHRVERLQAFIPCCEEGAEQGHSMQLLICRSCGGVEEIEDAGIGAALGAATAGRGFRPAQVTVEIEGVCARCSGAPVRARPGG